MKNLLAKWNLTKKDLWIIVGVLAVIFGIIATLNPDFFKASGILPSNWDDDVRDVDQLIELPEGSATDMIKVLVTRNVIPLFKYIFIGVSILYFTVMLFLMGNFTNEEQISKYKTALLWGLLGFGLISVASEIAAVFDPLKQNPGELMDVEAGETTIQKFIAYLQLSLGTLAIGSLFYAGFRFISAHGEEEAVTKAKNIFKWGFIGLIFVILADPLITKVFYPESQQVTDAEAQEFTKQMVAVLKFLLTFLGILAFTALIVSGFLYITSFGDEEKHSTAKNIIISSIIGILLILSSFALINIFIPPGNS